jgi:hypothetical protein
VLPRDKPVSLADGSFSIGDEILDFDDPILN